VPLVNLNVQRLRLEREALQKEGETVKLKCKLLKLSKSREATRVNSEACLNDYVSHKR
jgi:hypothetical protein